MDDIFYFTSARITLEDLKVVAEEIGYPTSLGRINDRVWLNVFYGGDLESDDYWECHPMTEGRGAYIGFETETLERIAATGTSSSFAISFYADSLPQLVTFLKRVLERFGGWIGGDTDYLEPIFTSDNIDDLWYPYFEPDPAVTRAIKDAVVSLKKKQRDQGYS